MTREDRLIKLGLSYEKAMGQASIERCNCMVRYKDGPQMPAIKRGKTFLTPEENVIVRPDSYEMMHFTAIINIIAARNEKYIGHMV